MAAHRERDVSIRVGREGLNQDALDAVALSLRELGQSMVNATLSGFEPIVRQAIAEAAEMELDRRDIARWFNLDRLHPDAQITVWHSDIRCETHIQVSQVIGREVQVMERVVPDEELVRCQDTRRAWRHEWFGSQDTHVSIHCDCTTCHQWRGDQKDESFFRALTLLLSCLSPSQRSESETKEFFTVTAKSGNRYRIERGYNFNIAVLDKQGNVLGRLCAGPEDAVPVYDSMLSQKLWLENDEEGFLRIANRSGFNVDRWEPFSYDMTNVSSASAFDFSWEPIRWQR